MLSESSILQNILLSPSEPVPRELCFRGASPDECCRMEEGKLFLDPDQLVDFTSYFNSFCWQKWSWYTELESLSLVLDVRGHCLIILENYDENGVLIASDINRLMGNGRMVIKVPPKMCSGRIGFKLKAVSPVTICGGSWNCSSLTHSRDIRPVFITCTFNRDEYLFSTLRRLNRAPYEDFDVIVVDNASRLEEKDVAPLGENIRLYQNPNAGGSGGFTRGLMEALASSRDFTHAVMMDDDIALEPETVFRTCRLLRHLKPEYHKHFLSGSMFYMDRPEIMFESTASWNGYRVNNHNKDLDLTGRMDLCRSSRFDISDNRYAAWWYCGIPLDPEMINGLPFPFFIYGDDMDFSFRWAKGFLSMDGIGVWHESFTRKFSPLFKSYFFCRNTLILNALHPRSFKAIHSSINARIHFYVQLLVHDYRSASLALDALEDFLEGAEYVTALDEQTLLSRRDGKAEFKAPTDKELKGAYDIPANFRRWYAPLYFLHRKIAAWDHDKKQAEIRKRSLPMILKLLGRRLSLFVRFFFRYHTAARSFRELKRDERFWNMRLNGLKEPD